MSPLCSPQGFAYHGFMFARTLLHHRQLIATFYHPDGVTKALRCLLISSALVLLSVPAIAEEVKSGPDVVIIAGKDKVVYEFRQSGELRMVRVVPKWGKPYYLVPRDDTKGFGNLERADMLLPQWVIAEF